MLATRPRAAPTRRRPALATTGDADGSGCTQGDACSAGKCVAGKAVVCVGDACKDGSGAGTLGQWFTSTGTKVGGEKVINAGTAGDQRYHEAIGLREEPRPGAWRSDVTMRMIS